MVVGAKYSLQVTNSIAKYIDNCLGHLQVLDLGFLWFYKHESLPSELKVYVDHHGDRNRIIKLYMLFSH